MQSKIKKSSEFPYIQGSEKMYSELSQVRSGMKNEDVWDRDKLVKTEACKF